MQNFDLDARRRGLLLAGLAAALAPAAAVQAQDYPVRPITLLVPFAAGGVTDAVARAVAKPLGERLGQPVVVDNRPGGGGTVATDAVARAKADGYTLLFGSRVTQITSPLVNRTRLPTAQDFAPISAVCDVDAVIVAHPGRPYQTVAELIAYAKAHPDRINFATPGNGTAAHLAAAVFMDLAQIRMTHVAYRGSAPAVQDLLGGTVDIAFDYPSSTLSFIKAGSLRPLASLSSARLPALPAVPTIAEAGVPGAETASWQAIFAPGRTPAPVVDRLVAAMAQVLQDQATRQRLVDLGTVPLAIGGQDLQQLIDRETLRWRGVVTRSGITAS